ncbi:MAG: tRNA preQ1(34) S-adenosylmethionine ribosyltransferase-isomerase QueA [Planctomycetota bacterium]
MRTDLFDYQHPPELVAQEALEPRDSSRLLLVADHGLLHRRAYDLPLLLRPGDLLVLNRSKVIPARLFGRKQTGGQVEVLLIHPEVDDELCWRCLIRGKVHAGNDIVIADVTTRVEAILEDGERRLRFPENCDVIALCEQTGHVPLPPYIRREDRLSDRNRYQSVFADIPGSVAAPTASLHLSTAVLNACAARSIETALVELRVGPGTFKPVQSEELEAHPMHAEWCACPPETVAAIQRCRERGGRVIAVGTTVVRTLESAARQASGFGPWSGWTRLYLYPPQQAQVVDGLLTNFHLPRSTLLMLVACFTGIERLHAAYAEAVQQRYRLFSYGDAMLILPPASSA